MQSDKVGVKKLSFTVYTLKNCFTLLRYTVEWIGREGLDIETHEEYLNHFISHFYKNIVKLVDRAMRKEDSSAQGQIVTEILQHLHACSNSVRVFYGREENLEHIKRYMLGDSDKPLVLYGEGGCGKTSLLAKSASLVANEWFANQRPINVIRFLGTTPDSSALTPTLISICQQVCTEIQSYVLKTNSLLFFRFRIITCCLLRIFLTI